MCQTHREHQLQLRFTDKGKWLLFKETREEVMTTDKMGTRGAAGKVLISKGRVVFMFSKLL